MAEDGTSVEPTVEPTQTEPTQVQEPTDTSDQVQTPDQTDTPEPPQGITDSLLDGGEGDQAPEPTVQAAPEAYEPFDVDGQQFSEDQVEGFATTARELGLSQENAQKMFAAMVPTAREYMMNDLKAKSQEWASLTAKDPEIGGANFEANKGIAKQAYAQYTTPELRAILTGSGLGNHPEVVRLFYRIGKSMQQDTGVTGGASAPAGTRRRYPKSNMVVDE